MNLQVLLGYAWPYRKSLAVCGALMLVESATALVIPWVAGQFAADVLQGQLAFNDQPGRLTFLLLLALFAVQALIRFTNSYVLSRTAEGVLADLRIRIYDHLQALPLGLPLPESEG